MVATANISQSDFVLIFIMLENKVIIFRIFCPLTTDANGGIAAHFQIHITAKQERTLQNDL